MVGFTLTVLTPRRAGRFLSRRSGRGRATFHYLIAVTEGEPRHDVDHVTRIVASGQWLWVRPGHAQCWHPPGTARGPFILFEPGVLTPGTARLLAPITAHEAPAVLSLHPDDAAWLQQTALRLLDEHRAQGHVHTVRGRPGAALSRTAPRGGLRRAAGLLGPHPQPRRTARSVAAHLGFTDPANFVRFFRDRTGITPAAFAARALATDP